MEPCGRGEKGVDLTPEKPCEEFEFAKSPEKTGRVGAGWETRNLPQSATKGEESGREGLFFTPFSEGGGGLTVCS